MKYFTDLIHNKSLLKVFIFSATTKTISSFGLIFFNILIIKLINKETLGLIIIGLSLITFLSVFAKFGLNHASLRFTSIFFDNYDSEKINEQIIQSFVISGFISLLISALIIIFEKEISLIIYKNAEIKGVLKIFALSLPFYTFIQIQKAILKSFKLPALAHLADLGVILIMTCLMIVFLEFINFNITNYRISLFFLISCIVVFSFINFILFYISITKFINFKFNKFKGFENELIKTLPDYFSIDFVNYVVVWGSIFLCSFFLDSKTLASFSSTYWLAYVILFFPLVLNSIFAPDFAINAFKNDKKVLNFKFNQNRNYSLIFSIPLFLLLFIFPNFFLEKIFNISAHEFDTILRVLLLSAFLRVIFGPQVLFLNMSNQQNKVNRITIVSAMLHIAITIFSLIYLNLFFVALSYLLTNFLKHIFLFFELKKVYRK